MHVYRYVAGRPEYMCGGTHICVCVGGVFIHVYIYTCRGQKLITGFYPWSLSTLYILAESFTWNQRLLIQDPLSFESKTFTEMLRTQTLVSLHASMASTLPVKQSLQPQESYFYVQYRRLKVKINVKVTIITYIK